MERFFGSVNDSVELKSTFGGNAVTRRMDRLRDYIATVRTKWVQESSYDDLVRNVQGVYKPEKLPQEVSLQLQRILSGFRDYADMDLDRGQEVLPERYPALELYCGDKGFKYLFSLMGEALRKDQESGEVLLALTTLLEFINIDLYNLRLSQIGDSKFSNFQGVVYRGMRVKRAAVLEYERIFGESDLTKRSFAVPLALFSASIDERVMLQFSSAELDAEDLIQMHWEIHVHGLDPLLLQAYKERYPDSVVTSICAMPVARLSPFGEKEVLLRGSFFQLIHLRHEVVAGRKAVRLVMVMLNANRDHTTEQASNVEQKGRQRQTFGRIVAASKFEMCANVAAQFSKTEEAEYRKLQLSKLNEIKDLDGIVVPVISEPQNAASKETAIWLGGSLFKSYPLHYAEQRRNWQEAMERNDWIKLVDILAQDYDWQHDCWFSVGKLYDDKISYRGDGDSLLHKLACTDPPPPTDKAAREAWNQLVEKASSPGVWKTLLSGEPHKQTAEELAISHGYLSLQQLFRPSLVHDIDKVILNSLQAQAHALMRKYASKFVDEHVFRMPELSVLLEMKRPELWVPIPHMYGGFLLYLDETQLHVSVFETVTGETRPRRTDIEIQPQSAPIRASSSNFFESKLPGGTQIIVTPKASETSVGGRTYSTDEWTNTPSTILSAVSKQLHLKENHPLRITRELIESRFPGYKYYNNLFPIVSTHQNFDSLGFPADHPGRSKTDTYYMNKTTVLRTHTSAHQADVFRANESDGFLISADVYRRDAIDRSHYPVFHQMEGAMTWDRATIPKDDYTNRIWEFTNAIPSHDMNVEDPNPTVHPERNPLQAQYHSLEECEAMAAHLKRSLENVVVEIFSQARQAAATSTETAPSEDPLRVRWVEAYFPFTSPSWELEIWWQGDWLEVLGCGIVKQEILNDAGIPSRSGWAFGLGLERIAMLMFSIPDIRLFWSEDIRFLSQFSNAGPIKRFVPFSKHPACYKDVAFWLPTSSSAAGGQVAATVHENDIMELVRETAGDLVEDVQLTDEFIHPKTGRKSMCYRINYRSLERTLTNAEANQLHDEIRRKLIAQFGVELR